MTAGASAARAARKATRALEGLARPAGTFDSSRDFRGPGDLEFYNVGTAAMRSLARAIHAEHKSDGSIGGAMAFADAPLNGRPTIATLGGLCVLCGFRLLRTEV